MVDWVEAKQLEMFSRPTLAEQLMVVIGRFEDAQNWIRTLEEELERDKELLAIQVNMGHNTNTETKLVEMKRRQEEALMKEVEPVASTTPESEPE